MPTADVERIVDRLGGAQSFDPPVRDLNGLRRAVEGGLPESAARSLLRVFPGLDLHLGVRLGREESAYVERVARLYVMTVEVWNGAERAAAEFLLSPHPLLEGRSPLDIARTELGARQVEEILERIEHGVF